MQVFLSLSGILIEVGIPAVVVHLALVQAAAVIRAKTNVVAAMIHAAVHRINVVVHRILVNATQAVSVV